MIFTQAAFVYFLTITLVLFFATRRHLPFNRAVLIIASYIFYGWADWRFTIILFLSSIVDFYFAIFINEKNQKDKKNMLLLSIIINIGLLSYFKYFALIAYSINFAAGQNFIPYYEIILPAGISFYTFQSMSYVIDVYKRKIEPTRSLSTYILFVSFFPQLVAGPIERATRLLPQFYQVRPISAPMIADGCRQVLAGFVMKVVIADRLSPLVDTVYGSPDRFDGGALLLATLFFSFQIYCDFAGYSNIAIGLGKIMGFEFMRNFQTPYFSTSLPEFWRRWHISLSTFFRDYLYVPLGGSRFGVARTVRNILIVFAISGLWHGANWTFVIWGLYHGVGLSLVVISAHIWMSSGREAPKMAILVFIGALATQLYVLLGWVFFRATSFSEAWLIFSRILDVGSYGADALVLARTHIISLALLAAFIGLDFIQRNRAHLLDLGTLPFVGRAAIYGLAIASVLLLGAGTQAQFIYFRF